MDTKNLVAAAEAASRVSPETVEKAVNALLKWRDSNLKTQKPQLLEQDEFFYLMLTLKKIPQNARTNAIKIPIPHSLFNPIEDHSEICLIIDDRPQSGLTKDAATKKIKAENIPISKVLKVTKLKTDFRPFEAKRKLFGSYDMFLTDKRAVLLLPSLLGKQFYKKKKIPIPIDLRHLNWKEQIDKACGSALFYLNTGTSSVLKVGRLSMGPEEIVSNVMATIDGIAKIVPSKWGNIRSFHLKLSSSLALPVYQAVPDLKLKIEVPKENEEEVDEEYVEAKKKKGVAVADEKNKRKKKGRIHEVRYMDSNISETLDDDEMGTDGEGAVNEGSDGENVYMDSAEPGSKKRKNEGETLDEDEMGTDSEATIDEGSDGENDHMGGAELGSKKRKNDGEMKSEKPLKSGAKAKKDDSAQQKNEKQLKRAAKDKKDDGVKQKKETEEDSAKQKKGERESEAKVRKKKSALEKSKSAEMKVNDKKKKKKLAAE